MHLLELLEKEAAHQQLSDDTLIQMVLPANGEGLPKTLIIPFTKQPEIIYQQHQATSNPDSYTLVQPKAKHINKHKTGDMVLYFSSSTQQ